MKMYIYLLIIIFCFYSESYQTHLRLNEWSHIRRILQNKETPLEIRQKTQQILYIKYENLAERMALQFKQNHVYKCSYIMQRDLFQYAKMGLCKAIKNYNPTYSFYPYVKIYIQGELFRCLTDLLPLQFKGNFSVVGIKDSYIARIQNTAIIYKIMKEINNKYIDYERLYYPSSIREYSYQSQWEQIGSSLSIFQRRILYIKYHYLLRGVKISNKKLAEYMGCSEEKIRYNIKHLIVLAKEKAFGE